MRSERSCHLQYTVAVIYSGVLITESQTERQADISDCRVAIASKTIQFCLNNWFTKKRKRMYLDYIEITLYYFTGCCG